MSDEPTQLAPTEPVQTVESQSTSAADPVAPQGTIEPVPVQAEILPIAEVSPTETISPVQVEQAPSESQPTVQPIVEPPIPAPTQPTAAQAVPTTPQTTSGAVSIAALRPQAQAARTNRIQKKIDKIMEFAREKKLVRNDDIEKLLHVSDSTAQRHLGALVKQGKLHKIGNRGSTHYEVI